MSSVRAPLAWPLAVPLEPVSGAHLKPRKVDMNDETTTADNVTQLNPKQADPDPDPKAKKTATAKKPAAAKKKPKKEEEPAAAGPGHNGVDRDLFLYHVGRMNMCKEKQDKLRQEMAKLKKQASADGIVLQTLTAAQKIAENAAETNTEEQIRLKTYLEFLRQPIGSQMTIEAFVASKTVNANEVRNTARQEGYDAGVMGYGPKDNPYKEPGDAATQAWLDGHGDGARRRKQIEKGLPAENKRSA